MSLNYLRSKIVSARGVVRAQRVKIVSAYGAARAQRVIIVLACGLALACGAVRAQRANLPLPTPQIPGSLGVNIHFNDPRPGEMEQLAAAGFHWIRQDFAWAGIEQKKGHYDFSAYERLLTALKPHGIRAIFILDYGNDLYEQGSPRTPEARAAFARFAAAAVSHFRGQGILWEMWNEPNGDFWKPKANVDEYIALALETGKAIRRAAPDEWYIGPGVSGMDFGFMERCFKAGLLNYWDAVSFHPYRDVRPETAGADYVRLREMLTRYAPPGKRVPILSSEWGYSELYPGLSLELQSKYIAREYLTNLLNGLLVSIWYDWHDDGVDPKEPEHHFGTVTSNYQPKPTYIAAQTLARQLAGYRFNKRLALDSPDDYCLLFSKGAQQRLVAWTAGLKPHTVDIPTDAGTFQVIDYLGKTGTQQAQADGVHLTLTDAPQYLIPDHSDARLTLAADWHTMPAIVYNDDRLDASAVTGPLKEIRGAQPGTLRRAAVRIQPVSRDDALLPDETAFGRRGLSLPLALRDGARGLDAIAAGLEGVRDERPLILRTTLQIGGQDVTAQEFEVRPRHPLRVTILPATGARLPVRVENPTGAPFNGRIRLASGPDEAALPLRFAAGEMEKSIDLPFVRGGDGEYTAACAIEEARNERPSWRKVVVAPAQQFTPLDLFRIYAAGDATPGARYQIVPDGDPKVHSEIAGTVVDAPAGLPGGGTPALRIAYDFAPGWKFLRLARTMDLPGKPIALGMWVYGDGSGDLLRARFTDATGQTFQPDGGTVDWKGWRYLRFPLQGDVGGHWGGANDGVIHYPIHLDSALLVDSPGGRGGKGVITVTDLTLIGPVGKQSAPR